MLNFGDRVKPVSKIGQQFYTSQIMLHSGWMIQLERLLGLIGFSTSSSSELVKSESILKSGYSIRSSISEINSNEIVLLAIEYE